MNRYFENKSLRMTSLDTLKGFACIAVVILHCPFPTIIGNYINAFCRFAVPLFFMISGYFCHFKKGSDGLRLLIKKIKHILFLITVSLFIYLIWGFVNDGPSIFNNIVFENNGALDFLLFNKIPTQIFRNAGHLWFLVALIYCYPAGYIVNYCIKNKKLKYILALFILTVRYIIGIASCNGLLPLEECHYQNFWLVGFPFFILGQMFAEPRFKSHLDKLSKANLIILMIIGCGMTCLEYMIFGGACDLFLGTVLMLFSMFAYSVKNPFSLCNKSLKSFCYIGEKLSLIVYIIHPIFVYLISIFDNLFYQQNWFVKMLYLGLKPIAVIFISILTAYLFEIFKEHCLKRRLK
ncbi:MAG: acyltransferase [Acutalibacteraceae bacterium]|nr:acyltransferase [Acutalibacteraceae bacterium]